MTTKEIESMWYQYFPKVFGYFYRRVNCREEVEELTANVMNRFILAMNEKDIHNPHAYLWQIAHNQMVSFIREKDKRPNITCLEEKHENLAQEEIENYRCENFKFRTKELLECAQNEVKESEMYLIKELIMYDKKSTELATELQEKPTTLRKRLSRSLSKIKEKCKELWDHQIN